MEKILLAINAKELNMVSLDFACWLAKLTRSKLIGVFLEDIKASAVPETGVLQGMQEGETAAGDDLPLIKTSRELCDDCMKLFEEACTSRGVRSSIHKDLGVPLNELVLESRFADLVVVDHETSFNDKTEIPSPFIKDLLKAVECPVIVSPFSFNDIEEVYFAYDGSADSLFAIKQFTYLFPQLSDRRIVILQADENEAASITKRKQIGELLQAHYLGIGFGVLHGNADDALLKHLIEKKNALLVMGSYGRGMLSRIFQKSTADLLLQTLDLPIFIAHH
jgi:nucleotide-binding universal stress UspA family protein